MELLAPAGNMTALHAAVSAGADAVYLGAGQFNARYSADNFSLEDLQTACDYAHLRGVSVYLTLNTVILPSEAGDALELVRQAFRAGVDAFIVQDIGVAQELAREIPQVRLHISTQMNIHDESGLRAVCALGACRVTLARELSLEEVAHLARVAQELNVEIEVFGHGALCVCYSGQCFMSSLVGSRSANRGRCAQACRLPYTLHNRALKKSLPSPGDYLLSPKDLSTIDLLPELLDAGVASLKIEGRMKSADYVANVVGVYRAVLDRALARQAEARRAELDCGSVALPGSTPISDTPTEEEQQALSEAFSRGFTTAYLTGKRGNEIMGYERPNNRGVLVGRVAQVQKGRIAFFSDVELNEGDGLEFWTNRGNFVYDLGSFSFDSKGRVVIELNRPVGKGDRIFRVRNAKATFVDSDKEPRVLIQGKACLHIGKPITLALSTLDGIYSVQVEGGLAEPARTKAVSAEEVCEHIDRMGSTSFAFARLDVELDPGVGIGFSALHKLRSQAVDKLQAEILKPYKRQLKRAQPRHFSPKARKGGCKVVALATNPACARAAKRAGADAVYVPVLNYRRGDAMIAGQVSQTAEQAGYPKQCIPVLPVVSRFVDMNKPNGFDVYKRVKEDKPVLVENIGQLLEAAERGALAEVGPHLPLTNQFDVQTAADFGAQRIWLSPELSLVQIEELGEISPVPLGLTIMGNQEMMVTEHCMLMSQGPCNEDCAQCARRKSPHYLRDRKGYEMPVVTDCMGRSHLYNAVSLDIAHLAPELIRAGVSAFMVDTSLMNVAEVTKKVARAVRARDIALKSGDHVSKAPDSTSGHLFRGVL